MLSCMFLITYFLKNKSLILKIIQIVIANTLLNLALVYGCVFILFHRKGFLRLQWCLRHAWGYRSTILCCEYYAGCFCQVPSSPYLKMSYFTSKDEKSSEHKLARKQYDVLRTCKKLIYIDIGYEIGTH